MSKAQTALDIFLLVFAFFNILGILNGDIVLDTQFVPTTLNGVTSSVSLIIGFTATILAIAVSKPQFRDVSRIKAIIILLLFPIIFLMRAYVELLYYTNYELALKNAQIGLIVSFVILTDFLFFLIDRLDMLKEEAT